MEINKSEGFDTLGIDSALKPKKAESTIEEAAAQFEAVFLHSVLKQMRATNDVLAAEDSPFSSQEQGVFRDMHDQHLATLLSGDGHFGLSEMLVKQLTKGELDTLQIRVDELNKKSIGETQFNLKKMNFNFGESL